MDIFITILNLNQILEPKQVFLNFFYNIEKGLLKINSKEDTIKEKIALSTKILSITIFREHKV